MKTNPAWVTSAEEEQSHFTPASYACQTKTPERIVEYSGTGFMREKLSNGLLPFGFEYPIYLAERQAVDDISFLQPALSGYANAID